MNGKCCGKIAALVVIGIAVLGAVVMVLWNGLMPVLFPGVKPIDYFQALGVLVLSKILFGTFRGHHGGRCGWRRGCCSGATEETEPGRMPDACADRPQKTVVS